MAVSRRKNAAFTLVEMLVVIAILGVLMALLLPAVNSVRESMRRATCKNNLAQIGKAAQMHVAAQGYFPSSGWGYNWVGDPDHGFGARQPGGWIYNILPYAGLDMVHDVGKGKAVSAKTTEAITAVIPFLLCPTRRRPIAYPASMSTPLNLPSAPASSGKTDYAANGGTASSSFFPVAGPSSGTACVANFPNCGFRDMSAFNGVMGERSQVKEGHIVDGLSNVFLAGEKYVDPGNYESPVPGGGANNAETGCALQGYGNDTNRWVPPTQSATACMPFRDTIGSSAMGVANGLGQSPGPGLDTKISYRFGSAHSAGLHFVFCDGHVQMVNYTINLATYTCLGVRNFLPNNPGFQLPDSY